MSKQETRALIEGGDGEHPMSDDVLDKEVQGMDLRTPGMFQGVFKRKYEDES